jgi:catechol 2,3-dioxygenase
MPIDPNTTLGPVSLTVRELERVARFYEQVVGLERVIGDGDHVELGVGGDVLVELVADRDAILRAPGTTGLFHLAILVPDRTELARSLRRVLDARWPLAGASDHLVSEAIYLADPERNGIEIYRDRPREEWRRDGDEIAMATLPLDLQDVMSEIGAAGAPPVLAPGTRIGHVHLQVADLAAAEYFYGELLGFDVTARGYPGALFLAAGGYHHHIGLNIWATAGASPSTAGSTGLQHSTVVVPDQSELERIMARLERAGIALEHRAGRVVTRDPSENRLALTARS